jgi:hypothetical protein
MTEKTGRAEPGPLEPAPSRAAAWREHRRRQARIGLELSPAERLRWLEQALETLRRWQGRARRAGGSSGSPAEGIPGE